MPKLVDVSEGNILFSGSRDYSVRTWDLVAARQTQLMTISRNVVTCAAWIPGESGVLQGSEDLRSVEIEGCSGWNSVAKTVKSDGSE